MLWHFLVKWRFKALTQDAVIVVWCRLMASGKWSTCPKRNACRVRTCSPPRQRGHRKSPIRSPIHFTKITILMICWWCFRFLLYIVMVLVKLLFSFDFEREWDIRDIMTHYIVLKKKQVMGFRTCCCDSSSIPQTHNAGDNIVILPVHTFPASNWIPVPVPEESLEKKPSTVLKPRSRPWQTSWDIMTQLSWQTFMRCHEITRISAKTGRKHVPTCPNIFSITPICSSYVPLMIFDVLWGSHGISEPSQAGLGQVEVLRVPKLCRLYIFNDLYKML